MFIFSQFFLIGVASNIQAAELAACPPDKIASTGLGGYCPVLAKSRTDFEQVLVRNFGGTFDGIGLLFVGLPLLTVIALIGLYTEKRTRKERFGSPFLP